MKLKIQKTKLKNLSKDKNTLDAKRTAQVAGGWFEPETDNCQSDPYFCQSKGHCTALGCPTYQCPTRQGGPMCG
ncbi:hypothetical protein PRUB_a2463 [Pseudoalteromonas rubra]|uniref:Uncharacterized protein n=1 Tax=Pseudoalteromonas rubra TaxID=43658 RepID=A0A8T0CAZ3_9GAMM|nr:hypothetical protein PRUB_a2463 [Pseudoalteromonas rubra]